MKNLARSLLLSVGLFLAVSSAYAWEDALHTKITFDLLIAAGFSPDEQASVAAMAAHDDGNSARVKVDPQTNKITFAGDQSRAFNVMPPVPGEVPAKTYGPVAIAPSDSRYIAAQMHLRSAQDKAAKGQSNESLTDLGIALRAIQNIFANRHAVCDATWTANGKMLYGAARWFPGKTLPPAFHNLDPNDDIFSPSQLPYLQAALHASGDFLRQFLQAVPSAAANPNPNFNPQTAAKDISDQITALTALRASLNAQLNTAAQQAQKVFDEARKSLPERHYSADKDYHRFYARPYLQLVIRQSSDGCRTVLEQYRSLLQYFLDSSPEAQKSLAAELQKDTAWLVATANQTATAVRKAAQTAESATDYAQAANACHDCRNTVLALFDKVRTPVQRLQENNVALIDLLQLQTDELHSILLVDIKFIRYNFYRNLKDGKNTTPELVAAFRTAVDNFHQRCDLELTDYLNASQALSRSFTQNPIVPLSDDEQKTYAKLGDTYREHASTTIQTIRDELKKQRGKLNELLDKLAAFATAEKLPPEFAGTFNASSKLAAHGRTFVWLLSEDLLTRLNPALNQLAVNLEHPADDDETALAYASHFTPADIKKLEKLSDMKDMADKASEIKDWADRAENVSDSYNNYKDGNHDISAVEQQLGEDIIREVVKEALKAGTDAGATAAATAAIAAIPYCEGAAPVLGKLIGSAIAELGDTLVGDAAADFVIDKLGPEKAKDFGAFILETIDTANLYMDAFGYGLAEGIDNLTGGGLIDAYDWYLRQKNKLKDWWNSDDDDTPDEMEPNQNVDPPINTDVDIGWPELPDIPGVTDIPDDIQKDMDDIQDLDPGNIFDLIKILDIAYDLKDKLDEMMKPLTNLMQQIQLFIKNILNNLTNFAVSIEHVDVESQRKQSLQVLTQDLGGRASPNAKETTFDEVIKKDDLTRSRQNDTSKFKGIQGNTSR